MANESYEDFTREWRELLQSDDASVAELQQALSECLDALDTFERGMRLAEAAADAAGPLDFSQLAEAFENLGGEQFAEALRAIEGEEL